MISLKKLERHEGLVQAMAQARGVDIGGALATGDLSATELRSAVFRCTACSDPDACEEWLARHPDGADRTPPYCRNTETLARLAED